MTRQELESLFLANLALIERILDAQARLNCLSRDDADEFGAWVKLRIIENEYAVFAKFRGDSTLGTYLTVVISMFLREYRVQEWGRWRPSAAAKRLGDIGIHLERLVVRDGLSIEQAGHILRASGKTTLSDRELSKMAATFPRRTPLRPVQTGDLPTSAEAPDRADAAVDLAEEDAEIKAANESVERALNAMSPEDSLIIRLHYKQSMKVADIARALGLPQKHLYRRVERLLRTLREALARDGITRDPRNPDGPP